MGADVQQATRQQGRREGRLSALAGTLVALAIATTSTPVLARAPSSGAAVPEPGSSPPVESRGWAHVAVDTSATGEAGPAIRRRVQERADVVLRRAGVMPGRGPQDPTINVVIREKRGEDPGWEYTITVSRPDEPMPQGETTACDLCTETELVDAIEGRLATVAAELDAEPSTADAGDANDDGVDDTVAPTRPVDPGPPRDPRKLGAKGKAGAALIGVGGGGLIAGIVLAVLPPRDASDQPTKDVFTDTPGYVLIGTGAAVLIVGAVLLGLDRREAKRQSKLRARIQITPARGGLGMRF